MSEDDASQRANTPAGGNHGADAAQRQPPQAPLDSPMSQAQAEEEDDLAIKYPLVYRHSWNYAAKLVQRAWKRFMMRVVYKFLLDSAHEFEQTLTPKDLSRIYPEFLESSDPGMSPKLTIRFQGESFPPRLVCRIVADMAPSVDGGKHATKWIPLFNAGDAGPINQKALVRLFVEAMAFRRMGKKKFMLPPPPLPWHVESFKLPLDLGPRWSQPDPSDD